MTERDHANDVGGHRGPVTESLAQQYIPPPPEEEYEPGLTVSTSHPLTQESVLPYCEGGLRPESSVSTQVVTGSEPVPNPPAQERLYSRGYEAQEAPTIMAGQAVPPFPPVRAFQQPVNVATHESTERLRLNGSGQDLRGYNSTIGDSKRQQAYHPTYDRSSQYSRQGGNTAEASNSLAREPLHIGSQTRAGQEARHQWNPSAAAQPAMNHDSHHHDPFITSNAVSNGGTDFPPAQTNTAPVPETGDPYRNQHMRVPVSETGDTDRNQRMRLTAPEQATNDRTPRINANSTRADQGHPPPRHGWSVSMPDLREGRRLEERAVGGKPPALIPGPTQPLGPPLKPLDGPEAEAIAQEQWRPVMEKNDRRR